MPAFSQMLVACAVVLWLAPPASAISAADRKAIVATLTPLFEQASEASSLAFSLGLADGDGAFGVAASPPAGPKVDGSSRYPMGSVTKTWSTVAALRLAERGVLDLDEPISTFVDPWLTQRNGTTLAQLWSDESAGGGASAAKMIATVTARQLMGMRSGVADYPYNDLATFALSPSMRGAGHDITPYDYLHAWTPKHFDFAPGTGGSYSSNGYVLLGIAMAAATGSEDWWAFDQRAALLPPPGGGGGPGGPGGGQQQQAALAASVPNFRFALNGTCDSEPGVVQQYTASASHAESPLWVTVDFDDIANASCLNGWTMGNIAAPPVEVATMLYALFGSGATLPRLVSAASLAAMLNFTHMTQGFQVGMAYGLGLMTKTFPCAVGACKANGTTATVGHVGVDWGSSAPVNEYSPAFDFAINLAVNGDGGRNCSNLGVDPFDTVEFLAECAFCLVAAAKNGSEADRDGCACSADALHAMWSSPPPGAARRGQQEQRQKQLQQPHLLRALGHDESRYPGPKFCAGTVCTGASAGLAHEECLSWKGLFATTGGQTSWSLLCGADALEDPCSCPGFACDGGHLTVVALPGAGLRGELLWGALQFPQLRRLDLSNNTLFGGVPPQLSGLQGLDHLDLSGNLLSGNLPDLGFALSPAQGGFASCSLGGNDFSCPLPPHAADACSAGSALACSEPQGVSPACLAALGELFAAPFVSDVVANLTQDASGLFGTVDRSCEMAFYRGEQNCSVRLDWGPFAPTVAVATDVLKLADPGADVCLLDSQKAFDCGGGARPCFENAANAGIVAVASGCSAKDRAALAAYRGRASQCILMNGEACTWTLSNASTCGQQQG